MQQLRAAREPLARKLLEAQGPAAKQRRFPFLLNLFIRVRHQGWGGLFFLIKDRPSPQGRWRIASRGESIWEHPETPPQEDRGATRGVDPPL